MKIIGANQNFFLTLMKFQNSANIEDLDMSDSPKLVASCWWLVAKKILATSN